MQHHVYDTSHALTTGIKIRKLRSPVDPGAAMGMVFYFNPYQSSISANRWHTTRDKAIADAEALREKKIASLEKQLAKLRAMTFDPPDLPEEN